MILCVQNNNNNGFSWEEGVVQRVRLLSKQVICRMRTHTPTWCRHTLRRGGRSLRRHFPCRICRWKMMVWCDSCSPFLHTSYIHGDTKHICVIKIYTHRYYVVAGIKKNINLSKWNISQCVCVFFHTLLIIKFNISLSQSDQDDRYCCKTQKSF